MRPVAGAGGLSSGMRYASVTALDVNGAPLGTSKKVRLG
jgi:hypothetical protein